MGPLDARQTGGNEVESNGNGIGVRVAWGEHEEVVGPNYAAIGELAEAMSLAIADVGDIAKAGMNTRDRYSYATASDVDAAIGAAMSKNGLAFAMSAESVVQHDRQLTNSVAIASQVWYRWAILHKGGAILTGRWASEAVDSGLGDKGLNKCATAAGKYLKLRLFVAATTDEADSDSESGERAQQGQRREWQAATEGAEREEQQAPADVGEDDGETVQNVPGNLAKFREEFRKTINASFTRPASEAQQKLAVRCLEALFPGKPDEQRTNMRYDLTRFLIGKQSSKDFTSGEASAFIEWAIIGKGVDNKVDYTPRLHAQQAAGKVIAWLAEQKGQASMDIDADTAKAVMAEKEWQYEQEAKALS